ncbi:MAG: aminoacyl--tRNA ligase-related protein, partial [Thermoplasmata archaeon]
MKKAEDFSEWYNEMVERANLTDKRYPIKGMNVWTPYGWKIMRAIDTHIREEFDATNHDEVCFPLLIPEDQFAKEKEHIKGFDAEVFWVTHAGLNPLDVKLLLRPTSETAMYPMFSLWVRSHADLPLKTYQIVNTFRYETKQTRAFIRVREIHFFESHTCHADFDDAERQIREDYEIVERLARKWCIPHKLLKRTDWDKFPGADYTVGIDTVLPNGRTLQLGSIHQYKENFSRPYDIKYEDDKGEHMYVHQTTFGMSERLVGAIVAIHGDDKGIVLPPDVATIQIVVVPDLA